MHVNLNVYEHDFILNDLIYSEFIHIFMNMF
jgi:hypothetical protein